MSESIRLVLEHPVASCFVLFFLAIFMEAASGAVFAMAKTMLVVWRESKGRKG